MVDQVNSGSASGSSSNVEMDTVLELLEKAVLLIGQCNNTIKYERRKNVLLGVTGTSSSQVASMLKEKAAFLQKHDQALFGKDSRDHLTESLKEKKQPIEAITEVSKSTNRKRPFREGPSFYQGRPNGGQKFRSNHNGKYILFQKKGTPSQQQPNFISSYDKHGGFNSCSSNTKKIIFQTNNSKMCSSREDNGISPGFETTDKRSRALGFSRRLPNSSSNGTSTGEGSKSTKVKSGAAKTSRPGSEGNAEKGFHFKSLSLKSGIFEQFVSDQQKRWRKPTSHKFEGCESVYFLQALQDGRFALPEICVTKRGLHVLNRPERCILQCSSTQRFMKISTVSLGRELVRVPVPMLWFGTSSQNIHKIIKGSNLSFETSYDKGHNLSRRFIDFGKQYERNIYGKGLCDLSIATSRLCNKSEEVCLRSCTGNRVLSVDCEFPNYDFVITSGKDREDKESMPDVIQGIKGNISGFDKTNRNTLFNHSSSAPSTSTVSLLTTTANCISETITALPHFG